MSEADEILDDLFHGVAFAAFVEEACMAKGVPCPEKTRARAYLYYEQELAKRNQLKPVCSRTPNAAVPLCGS